MAHQFSEWTLFSGRPVFGLPGLDLFHVTGSLQCAVDVHNSYFHSVNAISFPSKNIHFVEFCRTYFLRWPVMYQTYFSLAPSAAKKSGSFFLRHLNTTPNHCVTSPQLLGSLIQRRSSNNWHYCIASVDKQSSSLFVRSFV